MDKMACFKKRINSLSFISSNRVLGGFDYE